MKRYEFSPRKKFLKCKRCRRKVKRTGTRQLYCKPCAKIEKEEYWNNRYKARRRYKPGKCRDCGKEIPVRRRICTDCQSKKELRLYRNDQEKIIREVKSKIKPRSKANIEKARDDLLTRTKPSYNLHQVQTFNPEKFARVVDKCLKGEAIIAGTSSGE